MAGGNFSKLSGKTRPGTYINFESSKQDGVPINARGVVLLPLINHGYGPEGEFIPITCASPDAMRHKLGYSVYDNNAAMLLIREALKNASTVKVYIPKQGAAAKGVAGTLTGMAQYGGIRGNDLKFSVVANPDGGFDLTKFIGSEELETIVGVSTVEELVAVDSGEWITFSGTGDLTASAGVSLTGGVSGVATTADITTFFDQSESEPWNTMAFPIAATSESGDTTPALHEALKSKMNYLRDGAGKYRNAVVANYAADYEGIINVTNGVFLADGTEITAAQAVAWVAGATAAASNATSLTYVEYSGATSVNGAKDNAAAIAAINAGEFFFSVSEAGKVVVEYDINSLTTFTTKKTKDYRKSRVIRVYDTFGEWCVLNFPPNKFDNNPDGWDSMEGIGRSGLAQFEEAHAIKNVNLESDFTIDRERSTGDETYFNVALQATDGSEKAYFTIKTK